MQRRALTCMFGLSALALGGCSEASLPSTTFTTGFTTTFTGNGDGDGDATETGDTGDGDGDTGDGDGDAGDGDGDAGDGDGDGDAGDGDGDGDLCPNGVVDPGEQCDVGVETMFCDGDCTYAMCGDGYHNMLSEACDDGNALNTDGCVGACVLAVCGDGNLYEGIEDCDDDNLDDTDACTNNCIAPVCGDGSIWEEMETCDDQNMVDTDACTNACQVAACGDGILWGGVEMCDDGNMANNDACPGSCEPATCGDGFVLQNVEECDDANNNDNDGCDSQCMWVNGGIFELILNDNSGVDNMINTAVLDFFNMIPNPQPTDYIFVSVFGDVFVQGAWCATRADWYRSEYIAHYGQSTTSQSGNWNKWTSANGMNWSGQLNTVHTNYWGQTCDAVAGSWCTEWGIGQQGLSIVITPQAVGAETYGSGWNSGNATFTLRYAASRLAACGF
jgi:cysteine-rich repeat protein